MIIKKTIVVNGVKIFYRVCGDKKKPPLLLLHGFPSSSHMFRHLIPLLSSNYYLIAPDLPGFGFSEAPDRSKFAFTFDNIANIIDKFTQDIGLERFAIYIFDYGAPIGFRLALAHPEKITALISQNGNAYEEGLSEGWLPVRKYWNDPTQANRDALRSMQSYEITKWQYLHGVSDPQLVDPETYTLDYALMQSPNQAEIQLDFICNYITNLKMYPAFQEYFSKHKPPTLVVWGKNDPFFLPEGAKAFKIDNPEAEVHLLDTGHFALETHVEEIAALINNFLKRKILS